MNNKDLPLHHYPSTVGLNTGMEIAPNWMLALKEFRELAAESRKRRVGRKQAQNDTLLEAQADAV